MFRDLINASYSHLSCPEIHKSLTVLEGKAAAIRDDARLTIKISCLPPLVGSFILLNLPDELEAQTCKANHRGLMARDDGRRKVRDVHQQWLTEVAMLLRAAAALAGLGLR